MPLLMDRTLDFVRHGYRFTEKLRASSRDAASGRRLPVQLFGSPALIVRGLEGVRLFYDTTAVKREGAMPGVFGGGLFGEGSVHKIDDEQHRAWRDRIAEETRERGITHDAPVAEAFAEEVRRFYPFVPMLPAVARRDVEHEGITVKAGERVVVDVYGALRDPEHWASPESFDPSRFLDTDAQHSEVFIPQGGGDVHTGHRCPGELIVVGLLAQTAAELSVRDWTLPPQDLDYSMRRLPALPPTGVTLTGMGPA
ncbi:MAG: cytochrome P450 [Mobilicoccus sp.]|nr:cytochrome P450 [Mobilicoccus sp.]